VKRKRDEDDGSIIKQGKKEGEERREADRREPLRLKIVLEMGDEMAILI
jgi:hypothetical protein